MTDMPTTPDQGQRHLLPYYLIVLALVGLLFVLVQADAGWSGSVDLSHHYALAFRLGENWTLLPDDPTLGEMNVYPRLAHIAAALVGLVTHSTLMGMQVVALGALAAIWGAYLLMLATLPRRFAAASALLLALLIYLNHTFTRLPVHGAEIVESYFFSQLVAQALTLLVMALAIHLEQRASRWHAYALLLAALYVVAGTHLLPAIELLGVLAGLLALDVLAPGQRRRPIVLNSLLLVAGIGIVVLHPAFAVMRGISENNGSLGLIGFPGTASIVALCVASLIASLCLLRAWWRDELRLPVRKYLAVYGAALAALCLLQIVLVQLHIGSEYAVKKYVFGLLSFVVVAFAVLTGPLLVRASSMARLSRSQPSVLDALASSNTLACVVMAAAAAITVFNAAAWSKVFDVSDAVALERQLVVLQDSALAAPSAGRSNVVVDLPNQPAAIGYMFSIGILHVPRGIAIRDNFGEQRLGPATEYASVITGRGQGRYGNLSSCARTSGPLVALDPVCLQQAVASASVCKGTFDFTTAGKVDASMLTGFSGAEATFRWTDGHRSTVTCQIDQPMHMAQLTIAPFLSPGHQRQRATISVNGGTPVMVDFNGTGERKVVDLPLPETAQGSKLVFTIDMPDAISPQVLGLGADGRQLGLAVQTLVFH